MGSKACGMDVSPIDENIETMVAQIGENKDLLNLEQDITSPDTTNSFHSQFDFDPLDGCLNTMSDEPLMLMI